MYLSSSLRDKLAHKLFKGVSRRGVRVREELGKGFEEWVGVRLRFQTGTWWRWSELLSSIPDGDGWDRMLLRLGNTQIKRYLSYI